MSGSARGTYAQTIMSEEVTQGTAPTTPNSLWLPTVSNSLAMKRGFVKSRVITGNRNDTEPSLGRKMIAGQHVMQPDSRSLDFLTKHIFPSQTVTGAGPYTKVGKIGLLPPGLTLEKYFSDLGDVYRHLGCRIGQWQLSINDEGHLEITQDITGFDEVDDTALLDAAPKKYAVSPFLLPSLTVNEGGSPLTVMKNLQITISQNLDGESGRTIGSGGALTELPEGTYGVSFSFEALYRDKVLIAKARAGAISSLSLSFPSKTAGHSWAIAMNEIEYEVDDPIYSGPTGVLIPMKGMAFWKADAANSMIVSTLINDIASNATIPA